MTKQAKQTKQKKKLCWNCEGNVAFEAEECPYCGVYLSSLAISGNMQAGTLSAPYKMEKKEEVDIPEPPYADLGRGVAQQPETQSEDSIKDIVFVIGLMLSGIIFLLFSLALLFFSNHGVFVLKWNADFWFVYLLVACPMLYFGWKRLQKF